MEQFNLPASVTLMTTQTINRETIHSKPPTRKTNSNPNLPNLCFRVFIGKVCSTIQRNMGLQLWAEHIFNSFLRRHYLVTNQYYQFTKEY